MKAFTNDYLDQLITDCRVNNNPLPTDAQYAFYAYINTRRDNESELIVSDLGFPKDVPGFMRTLALAGINEFILTERSTALMEALNILLNDGWQVTGTWLRETEYEKKLGLRLRKEVAA